MSNDQILLLNSRRKRNQSIEAAMASISNLMNTFAKDEGETSTITDFREDRDKSSTKRVNNEEKFLDQFNLPPNTSMARQDTFGEVQQSSNVLATERLSLPGFTSWSLKSNDTILNDTYYSLDRGPSFDYESNALVREAKRVSIKKSPTIKRSPNIDVLRKSFSCGNLRSRTTTTETYDSFLHNQMLTNNLPILNLARHTRDSSFSISSPETVLTSYFSDTEDFETPESPIFHHHTHEEAFSTTPTLRQIRNGFHYDQVPNIESVSAFKIKPLTLSLPPKPKSEAIKKILRERVASSNNNEDKIINHTFGNTAMRYQHSEPISEAERLIQNYFADTNLMRQHLYNEYNTIAQQPHREPEEEGNSKEILSSDTEVLLDISTGGWGGRYSTGEEVPPLLYHESSEEYFREQLPAMKAEDKEVAERIDSNKTPTDEFQPNILPRLSSKDYSKELGMPTQQEHSESTTALQVQVPKGNKTVPPVIPPKSPHRPQTMLKSASHSLDLKSRPVITHLDENHPLKRRDFVDEGLKESVHLMAHKPHMLQSSRSENALDRHYNSGHDDNPSSLEDERTSLTLSRLGFHSNKRNHKFHRLYKSNQAYTGSDEDLGFSTNVTPSSHRSSRLIRSVAALKSLSKRITSRKSQLFDFSQKIQSNKEVKEINSDQSTQSNLSNNFDSDTQRNGSLSPFQQVYARAWPIRKASKSPMAVANKMQNYF